jgi:uncharacterized protein YndB with AHSA1/START domain
MSVETMNELRMTRTIHADQQAVWDAWTQPEHMKKWSCPDPTGVLEVEMDLKVSGAYRIVMEVEGNSHIALRGRPTQSNRLNVGLGGLRERDG